MSKIGDPDTVRTGSDDARAERSGEKMEVRDPQNGVLVGSVPRADATDVRAAVGAALAALEPANRLPAHRRAEILDRARSAVVAQREEFARTISTEGIKTIREARREVDRCAETLRLSAEEARRLNGATIPFDQVPSGEGRVGWYVREPVGVIGAITPFNDPLNLVVHKVGPAIAGGNAVIVKPHEETPLSALLLVRALHDAGLPPNALQVITGSGEDAGHALVTGPRVRMISFTGGRRTGETIIRQAGLKKVSMELGNNAPNIVMADADVDSAVAAAVDGAFAAAGQNCLHVQRLLIQDGIYDSFKERFVAAASALRVGDKQDETVDIGPLINEAAAARVARTVEVARRAGARLLTGGERSGSYYSPTVLDDVPDDCALAREEVFGPVTILCRFQTIEEAIGLANGVDYGLQAAIFTEDLKTAFRAVAELEYGGVMVNDSTDYRIDAMPFGGVKGSGLGHEGVRFAVEEMTEVKAVCFNA